MKYICDHYRQCRKKNPKFYCPHRTPHTVKSSESPCDTDLVVCAQDFRAICKPMKKQKKMQCQK